MTETTENSTPPETLVGLPRARQLIGKIEDPSQAQLLQPISVQLATRQAQAAQAQAIATISLAESAQLEALISFVRLPLRVCTPTEAKQILARIRVLAGLPPQIEEQDTAS